VLDAEKGEMKSGRRRSDNFILFFGLGPRQCLHGNRHSLARIGILSD